MLCNLYLNHLAGILSIVIYVCMFGIRANDYKSDLRQESKKKNEFITYFAMRLFA